MRISATQRKSGDWRSAEMERLGDVSLSEGEVLRSSDTRWLGVEMSRLDVPGKATALQGEATRSGGKAECSHARYSKGMAKQCTEMQG